MLVNADQIIVKQRLLFISELSNKKCFFKEKQYCYKSVSLNCKILILIKIQKVL